MYNDNFNGNMNNNNYGYNMNRKETNGLAIAGFVCSFLIPLVGLILSIIGLNKASVLNDGKGLSIAGIIISSISLFYGLIWIISFFVGFFFSYIYVVY